MENPLVTRYEQTGNIEYLQEAISLAAVALGETSDGQPNRACRSNNLANLLARRFDWFGAMDDLALAISLSEEAVRLSPLTHPSRASRLNSLGNCLVRRYERTGDMKDLELAIHRAAEVARIALPRDPNFAAYLSSLGNLLAWKFKVTGNSKYICEAIFWAQQSIAITPADSLNRANRRSNLGSLLKWKFEQSGNVEDIKQAVLQARVALAEIPSGHPNRATFLSSLADLLAYSLKPTPGSSSREDPISLYIESWSCANGPPTVRIAAARKAANILITQKEWKKSSTLLHAAVSLLPTVSTHSQKQRDQQHMVRLFAGISTLAASVALEAGEGQEQALQVLELGRGIIAGLQLRAQASGTDKLTRQRYMMERLARLPDQVHATEVLLSDPSHHHQKSSDFGKTVSDIRPQPGFARSLAPQLGDEPRAAAANGPIVLINVSYVRCDAILVEAHAIRRLPLHLLHATDVKEKVEALRTARGSLNISGAGILITKTLEWLWDAVASPVLDALGFHKPPTGPAWPRVWWVPTGLLSLLPLHAAGRHQSGSYDSVIDRVVSSYSPSLTALLHTQRNSTNFHDASGECLLVSMAKTPGHPSLPHAEMETELVENLYPSSAPKVTLKSPSKKDVIFHLKSCDVFHFAGHGKSDPHDPLKSCLLLNNSQSSLKIEDLIELNRYNLRRPFLAYLSACSTGENAAEGLQDESINLMTACQLAGFRHVVGLLWETYDLYSFVAAREFYTVLGAAGTIDDRTVAWGVHQAARYLRKHTKGAGSSTEASEFAWAAYIHVGP
ncbi:CHAT domain-containing protein [Hyaloscypha finlandica]|nr:CHAT domain-containing protein [Hyaloscypha finlandica]